jgi:hypothetical protein
MTTASTVIPRRTGVTLEDGLADAGAPVCYRYRMLRRRALAFIVSLCMLALPATSFAQSAGDDQYQDPLANGGGSTNGHTTDTGRGGSSGSSGSSSGGSGGGGGGSTSSAPSTSSGTNVPTAGSTGSGTASPTATAAQANGKQLPRTGFDVVVTFELGFAMLLVGLVAQRMIVLRERRDS